MDISELLEEYSGEIKLIFYKLREIVLEVDDNFTEKIYPVWRGAGFHHPAAGYVCGIFPTKKSVNFYFQNGAKLEDPFGILEGNTKNEICKGFRDKMKFRKKNLKFY